jgi:hypothetical protein
MRDEVKMHQGRRNFLGVCLGGALAACQRAPTTSAPKSQEKGTSMNTLRDGVVDLAWHNLSEFHGDGERLAFVGDGRVFYERLERDALLRWATKLPPEVAALLASVAGRLAATAPVLPHRLGIPDEVSVLVHYRDGLGKLQRADVWEDDIGKLPTGHVIHELRFAVTRTAEALTKATHGTPAAPDDAGQRWPFVFAGG